MADEYNTQEMKKMQQDAINRVRQMQQKADFYVKTPHLFEENHQDNQKPVHKNNQQRNNTQAALKSKSHENTANSASPKSTDNSENKHIENAEKASNPITAIISSLFSGESDKLLVMGLILLLSKEKADQMLIMALVYILM